MFIQDDINNLFTYENLNIDMVYHLAASADIRKSYADPLSDSNNNIIATNLLLEYLRKNDIGKLVFTSSSAVYGEHNRKMCEDELYLNPKSIYGVSKLCNELYMKTYCKIYGIKVFIFRLSNISGKYISSHVIVDFYNKLKKNKYRLEILGNGLQRRSFLSVVDCVKGLTFIPMVKRNHWVNVFNMGNIDDVSIIDLAGIVCNELGFKPELVTMGDKGGWIGDIICNILCIDKIQRLGWNPSRDSIQVVCDTVKYLKGIDGGFV